MSKLTKTALVITAISLFVFGFLIVRSLGFFESPVSSSACQVTNVTANIHGTSEKIRLPYKFKDLTDREKLSLSWSSYVSHGDFIYIKTVYSPVKVYANGALIYSYGSTNDYPSLLKDPPTAVKLVKIPESGRVVNFKVVYFAPIDRDALSVQAPIIGGYSEIFNKLYSTQGFLFIMSIVELFMGLLLLLIACIVLKFSRAGMTYIWLGLFALCAGIWSFGECNLTGTIVFNPTLLYFMAFMGLFTIPLPLIQYTIFTLELQRCKLLRWTMTVYSLLVCITVLLQVFGAVPFHRSLFAYHLAIPVTFVLIVIAVTMDYMHTKDPKAKLIFTPITILVCFSLLEVLNYQLKFTYINSLFFQIGILLFILAMGFISGYSIRDNIVIKRENMKLEYELALMEKQISAQADRYRVMTENQETIRSQRHDMRHQLAALRLYNERGERDKIQKHIDSLITAIPDEKGVTFCENPAVNAVIYYYHSLALNEGIDITVQIEVPEAMGTIRDTDMCVIAGNLMENAIEGCRTCSGKKFIRLKGRIQSNTMIITMDNSFDGKYEIRNHRYISRKRNEPGTGLASIEAVAKKYGGDATFEAKGDTFLSSVYFYLEPLS